MSDLILDDNAIKLKIQRLAYEIYEHNYKEKALYLLGINTSGYKMAESLCAELKKICTINVELEHLKMNPAKPNEPITLSIPAKELSNKVVIIVDDVANTGRTLIYACRPIMDVLPKKIEFAVLVDRKHKQFPVNVDYVGLSLATTLKENIEVIFAPDNYAAYLS